ncbi:MAG: SufD family Fe-S cluster assembly protein [Rikenellaceae bacterium]
MGFTKLDAGENVVVAQSQVQLYAINPSECRLRVGAGSVADVVLLHGDDANLSTLISLEVGATLHLTEIFMGSGSIDVVVNHAEGAISKVVAASLTRTSALYNMQLCAQGAFSELYTLQMGAERDNNSIRINMRHLAPDCSSRSLSKCVGSGESNLRFDGLVYVAQDAQRTAAEQNCRSIELSDTSHIVAQPQLEIYADDVKCTHGATMGQVDTDAILYMRQRGLSEMQARRLQIEGFITDIVEKCNLGELGDALRETLVQKLETM